MYKSYSVIRSDIELLGYWILAQIKYIVGTQKLNYPEKSIYLCIFFLCDYNAFCLLCMCNLNLMNGCISNNLMLLWARPNFFM
jgi:hypothetical protein